MPAFKFDAARWTRADRITGIATLVLLISLFLTWFTVSVNASVGGVNYGGSYGGSGVSAHGYLYLVFLICLAVLALLVLKAGWGEMPFKMPLAETQLVLIATVVNLVLVLIAFLLKPSAGLSGLHVGWGYGAFVALIAAIVACAPTAVPAIQARRHQA
ncbi:MAG TPA: hypothetical protein VMQ59_03965 [Acidimicrobiales bacterium]|nr:hypothetical protein [Acidimicrobiales bacterium]